MTEDLISFPGRIHLITSDQHLLAAMDSLSRCSNLGFDTETRPSFKKGDVFKVALLQLSTETDAYLIRLQFLKEFAGLKAILENPQIVKVGVAIRDDLKTLQKCFPFEPKSFVELQDLAKTRGLQNFGLKGMTAEVLQRKLSKGPKLTNWENTVLSEQQLMYAATDAWIGLKLYEKLSV